MSIIIGIFALLLALWAGFIATNSHDNHYGGSERDIIHALLDSSLVFALMAIVAYYKYGWSL